jgi:hypothetical protein
MANTFGNPIVLTGSMPQGYKAATAAALGTLRTLIVTRIRWVNPGISQTISIGDPISGLVLWSAKSNTAGEDVVENFSPNPQIWQDFELNALPANSTVYIYTR